MEAGADSAANRELRRHLVDSVHFINEAAAERIVMFVAAGNAHAERVGKVGFGSAVGAPAPLAPAARIGRAGATVTAGAGGTARDDALGRIRIPRGRPGAE